MQQAHARTARWVSIPTLAQALALWATTIRLQLTTVAARTTVVAPMMAPAALPASTRAVPRARRVPQASTSQVPVSREVRALHAARGTMLQPRGRRRARLAQPERQQRTLARTFVLRALVESIRLRLAPRGARAAWLAHISHRREVHERVPTRVTLILLF